jgi:replicative DNA helicase
MNALAAIETPTLVNTETEAALLGGMMQANERIDSVADMLKEDDFAEHVHQLIFAAIVRERSLGHAANPVTLRPYFEGDPAFVQVGGSSYLSQLTGSGAHVVGIKDFAEQVRELSRRRKFIEGMREAIAVAHDWGSPLEDAVAATETAMADATDIDDGRTELSGAECIDAAFEEMARGDNGVSCGIGELDVALGPIRRKDLVILAGRPGMGKTATALCYAKGAAHKGHGVLFVSLEMSAIQLGERILADETYDEESNTGVPYDLIVNGTVSGRDMAMLKDARDAISKMPIQIVDTSAITPARLQSVVRRWKRRFAAQGRTLDLVVVDYLQKMRVPGTTNRFEVITEISQSLKELAKGQDVGVLALAQLSRKVEDRDDKRPMLSDLRESGQLEQDADAVLFLLRQEYYLRKEQPNPGSAELATWEEAMRECAGRIEFICAKRRKGIERTTRGRFFGAYQAVRG